MLQVLAELRRGSCKSLRMGSNLDRNIGDPRGIHRLRLVCDSMKRGAASAEEKSVAWIDDRDGSIVPLA